jgi:hypothetical protein
MRYYLFLKNKLTSLLSGVNNIAVQYPHPISRIHDVLIYLWKEKKKTCELGGNLESSTRVKAAGSHDRQK